MGICEQIVDRVGCCIRPNSRLPRLGRGGVPEQSITGLVGNIRPGTLEYVVGPVAAPVVDVGWFGRVWLGNLHKVGRAAVVLIHQDLSIATVAVPTPMVK